MLVLVGHSLYNLLNKVLYERFMQVHVGPYWTSVDVETETAFSLRPIGPYWTILGKRSTVGLYILRGAHNTQKRAVDLCESTQIRDQDQAIQRDSLHQETNSQED